MHIHLRDNCPAFLAIGCVAAFITPVAECDRLTVGSNRYVGVNSQLPPGMLRTNDQIFVFFYIH